jgi:hypothetical protein
MRVAGTLGTSTDGIILYKDVWPKDSDFVGRLERGLEGSATDYFTWKQAMVGDNEIMKDYRDCFDFKLRQGDMPVPDEFSDLGKVYEEVIAGVRACVKHYSSLFNLSLDYEEATNFVKYGPGQHFSVHPDSGFSYSCAVSAIGYINDDYEGGEYMMPYKNLKFKPEFGDVIVHPSDFIYAHASLPVSSGTKYSAVTMYDYNDRNHQEHGGSGGYASAGMPGLGLPDANSQVTMLGA